MHKASENRIFALAWRSAGLAIGIAGNAIMFTISGASMLVYFTMQTNLFVLAMFAVLTVMTAVQLKREGVRGEATHLNCSLQLAITFYITITFVVYWALLSWQNFDMAATGGGSELIAANYIVHGVVPLFAIIDWLISCPTAGPPETPHSHGCCTLSSTQSTSSCARKWAHPFTAPRATLTPSSMWT